MRRLAEDWLASGRTVGELIEDGADASRRSLSYIQGANADQMAQRWREIDKDLKTLLEQCESNSDKLEEGATKIEHAKLSIIGALVVLAAELVVSLSSAPLTLGLSSLAAPAAEAATVITIRMIIRKLVLEMLEEVLLNVGKDVMVEAFAQELQIVKGDRKSVDFGEFGTTVADAAITGVFGGAAGTAGDEVAERFANDAAKKFATSVAAGIGEGLSNVATSSMPWSDDGPSLEGAGNAGVTGFLQGMAERERK